MSAIADTDTADSSWAALVDQARRWMEIDPDPETIAQVQAALDAADAQSLRRWFGPRLAFGTAGLRGPVGPGPASINLLVGRQTAMGFCAYLRAGGPHRPAGPSRSSVVIGFDGRHKSDAIATVCADVFTLAGFDVHLIDRPAPTPLAAWLLRRVGAAGAMVITASHNPPQDNGIKVYDGDGAQIIPPADGHIAAAIDRAAASASNPSPEVTPGEVHTVGTDVEDEYLDWIRTTVRPAGSPITQPLVIAHTSMHGVGDGLATRALAELCGATVHRVESQRLPDPDFPTVRFPNPEEPGALDLVLDLARSVRADLVIANDPDADRCAAAVPARDDPSSFVALSGDQVGWLLAYRALSPGVSADDLFVTTVVSSQLMAKMVARAGGRHEETLTGFKWLCRPAMADPTARPRLAYEEALGYAIGDALDKDGIGAAVALCDLVAHLKSDGRTVWSVLDQLAQDFGVHVTKQVSIRTDRPLPVPFQSEADTPASFAGLQVHRVDRPADDVVRLFFVDGHRAAFRPSGTEPKFKVYLEAVASVSTTVAAAETEARTILEAMAGAAIDHFNG